MTLDEVMTLDGRELNEAVAVKMGWTRWSPAAPPVWVKPDGHSCILPDFCREWPAAMQVRDWARGLPSSSRRVFCQRLTQLVYRRLSQEGKEATEWIGFDAEPADYARAALLVEE